MIERFDMRQGGAYLPKLAQITPAQVKEQYKTRVDNLKKITPTDIEGICKCRYVNVKGISTPIPRALLKDIELPRKIEHYWSCNACVNHWGLDMCGCGSGEKFDRCKEGTEYCGAPMALAAWS